MKLFSAATDASADGTVPSAKKPRAAIKRSKGASPRQESRFGPIRFRSRKLGWVKVSKRTLIFSFQRWWR